MLLVGRLVNIAVPLTLGKLIEILEQHLGSGAESAFWPYLLAYVGLRFLQGGGGLNALRDVSYYYRRVCYANRADIVHIRHYGRLSCNTQIEVGAV